MTVCIHNHTTDMVYIILSLSVLINVLLIRAIRMQNEARHKLNNDYVALWDERGDLLQANSMLEMELDTELSNH